MLIIFHFDSSIEFVFQFVILFHKGSDKMATTGPQSAGPWLFQKDRTSWSKIPSQVCSEIVLLSMQTYPVGGTPGTVWVKLHHSKTCFLVLWKRVHDLTDYCFVFCRFYIESVAYLKDAITVELFFRNAKISVYNVSGLSLKYHSTFLQM